MHAYLAEDMVLRQSGTNVDAAPTWHKRGRGMRIDMRSSDSAGTQNGLSSIG